MDNANPHDFDFSSWPPLTQKAFLDATASMANSYRSRFQGYFSYYLRFLAAHGLKSTADSFLKFRAEVQNQRRPRVAMGIVNGVARLILAMDLEDHPASILANFSPLRCRNKEPRRGGRQRGGGPNSVNWDYWPEAHRQRWEEGLIPPSEESMNSYTKVRRDAREKLNAAEHPSTDGVARHQGIRPRKRAGHPSDWAAATVKGALEVWSMWLSAAQKLGFDPDDVSEDTINRFIDHTEERGVSGTTLVFYVKSFRRALAILRPGEDWPYLQELERNFKLLAKPVVDKFEKYVPLPDLYELGVKLMVEAENSASKVHAPVLFRDGLLIALLTQRPKRRRNIAEMRIGHELELDEDGSAISITTFRTKSGKKSSAPLPELLQEAMSRYLSKWRPMLIVEETDALWLSAEGTALAPNTIQYLFSKRTRDHFGFSISPHFFRTIFATWFGEQDLDTREHVSAALDHTNKNSIEPYLVVSSSAFASSKLATVFQRIRDENALNQKKQRRRYSKSKRQGAEA